MKKFNNLREETLEEKLKSSDPPFDPDPPKKNPSAVAGKYGQGYSTAKHLAKRGMAQGPKKVAEENLDEISTKTLAKAAKSASDPDSDYYYGKSHDPQKFADHAKKTKDAKSAAAVQGAADAKSHYARPGHTLGSYDKLANRTPARVTSTGKANKQDVKTLKGNIQRNEEVETTHEDPLVVTKDSDGNIHTHANLSVANAIHGTDVKHQAIHSGMPVQAGKFTFELSQHHASQVKEAKEKTEYDYEGDMARGQLQSIIMNAQRVHDMLKDNDNLPEWVQSKITLAEDYISTVSNYMSSEIDEAALNELSKDTLRDYMVAGHKKFDSIRNNTDAASIAKKAKLDKGGKAAYAKRYPKPASTPAPKVDPNSRGYEKGRYMGDSVEQDDEKQIDELKSSTYQSYVNKVTDPKVASKRGNTQKGVPKSIKAIGGVTKAIGKQNFAARLASAASRNF